MTIIEQATTTENNRPKRRVPGIRVLVAAAPLLLGLAVPTAASADTPDTSVTDFNVTFGSSEGGKKADAVLDGDKLTGTVYLRNPAPAGGVKVAIYEGIAYQSSTLSPPDSVTVPEGRNYASFLLTTHAAYISESLLTAQTGGDLDAHTGGKTVVVNVVKAPRWKLTLGDRYSAKPGSSPIPGIRNNQIPVSIGTTLTPIGAKVALTSDTPGVKVGPDVRLSPGVSGGIIEVTVSDSVPIDTEAHITATWLGQSVTSTFFIYG